MRRASEEALQAAQLDLLLLQLLDLQVAERNLHGRAAVHLQGDHALRSHVVGDINGDYAVQRQLDVVALAVDFVAVPVAGLDELLALSRPAVNNDAASGLFAVEAAPPFVPRGVGLIALDDELR